MPNHKLSDEAMLGWWKLLGITRPPRQVIIQDLHDHIMFTRTIPQHHSNYLTLALTRLPTIITPDQWLDTRSPLIKSNDDYFIQIGDGPCYESGYDLKDRHFKYSQDIDEYFASIARHLDVGYAGLSPKARTTGRRVSITMEAIGIGYISPPDHLRPLIKFPIKEHVQSLRSQHSYPSTTSYRKPLYFLGGKPL